MKKVLSLSIMALALIAFASTSAVACGSCEAHNGKAEKTATKASADKAACSAHTNATKASADKATCSATTNATKASANTACSQADMEACAKKMGVSLEECQKMCAEKGSMTMHTISIKGMTCGSCEKSLTTAIEGVAGVQKVVSISHKDGSAVVCVDKGKTCLTTLTKTITDRGYKAEIIPAVAKTTAISADSKKACAKTCSTAEKAACGTKDAPSKDASKDPKDTK